MDMDSDKIKELRKRLHYSQQEFADILDVDVLTVSRWERKQQRPRPIHQRKLARLAKKGRS